MAYVQKMDYQIGGIELSLSIQPGIRFTSSGRFTDFISQATPLTHYRVLTNPAPGQPKGSLLFDSSQAWRLFADADRRILWIGTRDFIPRLVGNFTSDYHTGEIFITHSATDGNQYIFPLAYPLGELIMTCLLGTGYGLMMHSTAVLDGDNGLLFAGTSGAGKTTTAKLWNEHPGAHILNDDHSILRKVNRHFRVYGTPWHGQGGYASAKDAPLRKIFILKHAPCNQAVRLSPAQATAALLVRSFAPLWDAPAMAFTLQFLDELCEAVPCYELGFTPDQSAVEYVQCLSLD